MQQTLIGIYPKISETKKSELIPFDFLLDNIKEGKWQDDVLPIRAMKLAEEKAAAKKKVPYVTLSGTFRERSDNAIIEHSGFIGMDIDDVDPEEVKAILMPDPYVYCIFTSIGGHGVCVIFRINPDKHREAYNAISAYLFDKYQLITDPTGINPSRARFISYDPHIYINIEAKKFSAVTKPKAEKKVPDVIYVQNDFDAIIRDISSKNIDITGDYHSWLRIGFAFADKFGENGRNYFHLVSQPSSAYEKKLCDRQYTNCLKAKGIKTASIASFYYLAKAAGISIISPQTKLIAQAAYFAKKGARTRESAVTYLKDAEGISSTDSEPIVEQVFANNIEVKGEDSLIEQVQDWLQMEYTMQLNEVTLKVEVDGRDMDDDLFDKIFIRCKIVFDKINAELLHRIIRSSTPPYNPFHDFFSKYSHVRPSGVIQELFACIDTDTGMSESEFFPDYVYHFGIRWLIGMIASAHGEHSVLMLVLTGPQGTNKSRFFRGLLPPDLVKYFGESKMDRGKDDDILMCKKLIIYDDEMSGKSKKDEKRMKELLSKDVITVRAPYGRFDIDMKRISVFCGATNQRDILNDPTGNRRIIPVNVLSIDFDRLSKINRVELLMEAYWLWKEGFQWHLTKDDIENLYDNTGDFQEASSEYDLLVRYFEPAKDEKDAFANFLTTTDIKSRLEIRSMQKLTHTKLGIELKKAGFVRKTKKVNTLPVKGYYVIERGSQDSVSLAT